ncbi:hypothetical protein MML48_9g00001478 [Holotrichia oblita]|uniref:Uncharacterized protein n=1 Tax=Holotrichia oblita TaxID=644536 RepID=A0ACB9SK65_HOLOL|nr:hypothetical protein MML48_9g00001478 [Holotrichia oblita]
MANFDELIQLNAIDLNAEEQNIAPRFYKKHDPFAVLTDIEFKKEFRLTKNMATELIHQLSPMLQEESRRSALNTKMKICDVNCRILNVSAQFPGSTHDAYIWQNSDVNGLLQELTNSGHTSYLLGDSGYPLRPWLLTPIPNAAPGSAEQRYNNTHRRIRATIERCNGILKSRFRCMLKHRVLHYLPERAAKIINVCVMMHNFCIDNQLPPPELVEDMDDLGMDVVFNEPNLLNNAYLAGRRQQERIVQQHFT